MHSFQLAKLFELALFQLITFLDIALEKAETDSTWSATKTAHTVTGAVE